MKDVVRSTPLLRRFPRPPGCPPRPEVEPGTAGSRATRRAGLGWMLGLFALLWAVARAVAAGPADVAAGERLVGELGCVQCHTDLPVRSIVRQQAPELGSAGLRYRTSHLLEFLLQPTSIRRHIGRARMPDYPLAEDEALALALYLETQRTPPPGGAPLLPDDLSTLVRAGATRREVTTAEFEREVAGGLICLTCHAVDGRGGMVGPELAEVGHRLQPDGIAAYLVAPDRFGVSPAVMPAQFYQPSADGRSWAPLIPEPARRIATITAYLTQRGARRAAELDQRLTQARQRHPKATPALGAQLFRSLHCAACHRHPAHPATPAATAGPSLGPALAPPLANAGLRLRSEWLQGYLRAPTPIRRAGVQPGDGARMPDFHLATAEATAIAAYLDTRRQPWPAARESWTNAPLSAFAQRKAQTLLDEKLACLGCHRLHGRGGIIGPDLTHAHARLQPDYLHAMIANPRGVAPHAGMPQPMLPPSTIELIARHLAQAPTISPPSRATPSGSARAAAPAGYLNPATVALPLVLHPPASWSGTNRFPTMTVADRYRSHCAGCHGLDGRGDGYNAPFLLPVQPAALADATRMARRPDDTLFDGIHSGGAILNQGPWMPAWGGTLSASEIRALVGHLRTLCRCEPPGWSRDGASAPTRPPISSPTRAAGGRPQ